MLDQNTDRMWFVIGAVIVGAAIIFIANGTIPEIFASVTDSFENVSGNATDVIDAMKSYKDNKLAGLEWYPGYYHPSDGESVVKSDDMNFHIQEYIPTEGATGVTLALTESLPSLTSGGVSTRLFMYDEDRSYVGYETFITHYYSVIGDNPVLSYERDIELSEDVAYIRVQALYGYTSKYALWLHE